MIHYRCRIQPVYLLFGRQGSPSGMPLSEYGILRALDLLYVVYIVETVMSAVSCQSTAGRARWSSASCCFFRDDVFLINKLGKLGKLRACSSQFKRQTLVIQLGRSLSQSSRGTLHVIRPSQASHSSHLSSLSHNSIPTYHVHRRLNHVSSSRRAWDIDQIAQSL